MENLEKYKEEEAARMAAWKKEYEDAEALRYAEECEKDMAKNEYEIFIQELRETCEDEEEYDDNFVSFDNWYKVYKTETYKK